MSSLVGGVRCRARTRRAVRSRVILAIRTTSPAYLGRTGPAQPANSEPRRLEANPRRSLASRRASRIIVVGGHVTSADAGFHCPHRNLPSRCQTRRTVKFRVDADLRENQPGFAANPQLEAKIRDVVGLYLNPPEKAIVLCVDEKSQVQALDRTAPVLPLRLGVPEKQTHDYVRHGTATLFAALEVATGKITDACYPRHRHEEFLRFLKHVAKTYPRRRLHIVVDNYATHKHPDVTSWLDKHKRITLHFTPHLRVLAEHGGDLLRHHHPTGHPARHVHLGQGPHRRDRDLHRRMERTPPAVHLDQDRRPDHPPRDQRSSDFNSATLDAPLTKPDTHEHC